MKFFSNVHLVPFNIVLSWFDLLAIREESIGLLVDKLKKTIAASKTTKIGNHTNGVAESKLGVTDPRTACVHGSFFLVPLTNL